MMSVSISGAVTSVAPDQCGPGGGSGRAGATLATLRVTLKARVQRFVTALLSERSEQAVR